MFDKVGQFAEQMATNVSRRQFLGWFGRSALAIAAGLGGLLAFPALSRADKLVCGAGSSPGCIGLVEGSNCSDGRCYGTCRRLHSQSLACLCRVTHEPREGC